MDNKILNGCLIFLCLMTMFCAITPLYKETKHLNTTVANGSTHSCTYAEAVQKHQLRISK